MIKEGGVVLVGTALPRYVVFTWIVGTPGESQITPVTASQVTLMKARSLR